MNLRDNLINIMDTKCIDLFAVDGGLVYNIVLYTTNQAHVIHEKIVLMDAARFKRFISSNEREPKSEAIGKLSNFKYTVTCRKLYIDMDNPPSEIEIHSGELECLYVRNSQTNLRIKVTGFVSSVFSTNLVHLDRKFPLNFHTNTTFRKFDFIRLAHIHNKNPTPETFAVLAFEEFDEFEIAKPDDIPRLIELMGCRYKMLKKYGLPYRSEEVGEILAKKLWSYDPNDKSLHNIIKSDIENAQWKQLFFDICINKAFTINLKLLKKIATFACFDVDYRRTVRISFNGVVLLELDGSGIFNIDAPDGTDQNDPAREEPLIEDKEIPFPPGMKKVFEIVDPR